MCPNSLRTTALPPPQTPLHPSSSPSPSPNPLGSRRPPRPQRPRPWTAPPAEKTPWRHPSLTPGVNGIRHEDSKYVPLTSGYDADDEYETPLRPDARQSADRCQAKTPSSQLELLKSVGLYLLAKGYQLLALMPVLQSLGLGRDGPQDVSELCPDLSHVASDVGITLRTPAECYPYTETSTVYTSGSTSNSRRISKGTWPSAGCRP